MTWFAFSVDLEPNKDRTLTGVREATRWVANLIPQATFYTTYRIATECSGLVGDLAESHEIGVHVHPAEFGHDHDQLAELPAERQRELITTTRSALAAATETSESTIDAFRAGRHSASEATLSVLADLGFDLDASVHIRYDEYLPDEIRTREAPFRLQNGLLELPTTWVRPSMLSRAVLRTFPKKNLTATSSTLRHDSPFCSGERAMHTLFETSNGVSMYMHPYDATSYHEDLENNGQQFRDRLESLVARYCNEVTFITASELNEVVAAVDWSS